MIGADAQQITAIDQHSTIFLDVMGSHALLDLNANLLFAIVDFAVINIPAIQTIFQIDAVQEFHAVQILIALGGVLRVLAVIQASVLHIRHQIHRNVKV